MKLRTICKSCKKNISIKSKAQARPDLIDELGEYFRKRCEHCGVDNEYHVNDVKAFETGNLPGIIAGILIIIITTVFFWNEGWITNVGFLLGFGVMAASNASLMTSNSKLFNKYYVDASERE